MPGGRPDLEALRRQTQTLLWGAGETARQRIYVSASAGAEAYGATNSYYYTERVVTGIFSIPRQSDLPLEHSLPGGQVISTPLFMVTLPDPIAFQDELIWRGSAWRAAGPGVPETIGGRVMWRGPLTLSDKRS